MKQQPFIFSFLFLCAMTSPVMGEGFNDLEIIDRGEESYQNQQFNQAAQFFQEAAVRFSEKNEPIKEAMALSNLSLSYQKLGKLEAAQQSIESSLEILNSQPSSPNVLASTLDIYGQLQLQIGETEGALETWETAETLYQELDASQALTQNRMNQAEALQRLGLYPRACQTLLEILELNSGDCQIDENSIEFLKTETLSPSRSKILLGLGNILRVIGNLESSSDVLRILVENPNIDRSLHSQSLLSFGNTKQALSRRSQTFQKPVEAENYELEALFSYQEAVKNSDSPLLKVQGNMNQLTILIDRENWNEATVIAQRIEKQLDSLPITHQAIYAQIKFVEKSVCLKEKTANCLNPVMSGKRLERDQHQEAIQRLETSIENGQKLKDNRSISYAFGSLGKLYEQMANPELAILNTEKAIKTAQSIEADDIIYQWYWQMARLYKQTNSETAANYYQLAFNTLKKLRGELVSLNPEIRFTFRETVEPIYREYANLLLTPETISQKNLEQARQVIEALRLAELDNFFRDACLETKETNLEEIDPKAAVFYTIIFDDRIETITAFPQQPLQNYSTEINQQELERISQTISQQLSSNPRSLYPRPTDVSAQETLDNLQASLERLYNQLIRPVEKQLGEQDIETLVFVMDGVLRNIPPAALYDGENYLIQKGYRIGFAPSLQLIETQTLKGKEIRGLLGGISEPVRTFDPLPGVERELENISNQIKKSEIILNNNFTQRNLEQKISQLPYQIVHLATHGEFSSNAEETFILAYDDRISIDELKTLLNQTPDSTTPIELLVLSACRTAAGDERAILGLAGVAVQAGARSTLASLWYVSDNATSVLMSHFYEELGQPDITKSEAFRRAQLKLLEDETFSHPFYWSAFVMVGNWL